MMKNKNQRYLIAIGIFVVCFALWMFSNNDDEYPSGGWLNDTVASWEKGRFQVIKVGNSIARVDDLKHKQTLLEDIYGFDENSSYIYLYGREAYLIIDNRNKIMEEYPYGAKKIGEISLVEKIKKNNNYDYKLIEKNNFNEFEKRDQKVFNRIIDKPNYKRPYRESLGNSFYLERINTNTFRLIDFDKQIALDRPFAYEILDGKTLLTSWISGIPQNRSRDRKNYSFYFY